MVIRSYGVGTDWEVRVLPNIYPAFSGNEPMVVSHLGPVYIQAPASGTHEIVVLTPEHDSSWADLSPHHSEIVMAALRDRMPRARHHPRPALQPGGCEQRPGGWSVGGTSPRAASVDALHPG